MAEALPALAATLPSAPVPMPAVLGVTPDGGGDPFATLIAALAPAAPAPAASGSATATIPSAAALATPPAVAPPPSTPARLPAPTPLSARIAKPGGDDPTADEGDDETATDDDGETAAAAPAAMPPILAALIAVAAPQSDAPAAAGATPATVVAPAPALRVATAAIAPPTPAAPAVAPAEIAPAAAVAPDDPSAPAAPAKPARIAQIARPKPAAPRDTPRARSEERAADEATEKTVAIGPAPLRHADLPQPAPFGLDPRLRAATAAPAGADPAPSAADATLARTLSVAQDGQWLDGLARDIAATASGSTLHFRLEPQHLGSLDVAIRHDDDGATVRMTADRAETRQLLADAQPRLAAEARAQGLSLKESSVGGGTADQRQEASGGAAGHSGGQPGGGSGHQPRDPATLVEIAARPIQAGGQTSVTESTAADDALYA